MNKKSDLPTADQIREMIRVAKQMGLRDAADWAQRRFDQDMDIARNRALRR